MPIDALPVEDCRLLGIEADASLGEVERAWRDKKAIYAEDSLATYGLLEGTDRQEKLDELESAYGRVVNRMTGPGAKPPASLVAHLEECLKQLSPDESVGKFLREARESSGLTLKDIANRTKVSPMRLEQIEKEMFDRLPVAVYLRGFVLGFAKVLGFPQPEEVAGMYLARYKEQVPSL